MKKRGGGHRQRGMKGAKDSNCVELLSRKGRGGELVEKYNSASVRGLEHLEKD